MADVIAARIYQIHSFCREMTSLVANGIWREPRQRREAARAGLALVLFGAFLSMTGAIDTEQAATVSRTLYWVFVVTAAAGALILIDLCLQRIPAGLRPISRRIVGWALATVPVTILATVTCKILFGGQPSLAGFAKLLPGVAAILAVLQIALTWATGAARSSDPPGDGPLTEERGLPTDPGSIRFRRRDRSIVPLPLRRPDVIALKAEDHYVRIYSASGERLVRMRMADALAAVAHRDGIQPHRSWWIAAGSIVALGREGAQSHVTVSNGLKVPVSRRRRAELGPRFGGRPAP